jgi:hypothetical protein
MEGIEEQKDRLSQGVRSLTDGLRAQSLERVIGEKLLNYVGSLLLVLGGAFFLKYTFGFSGPLGKLAISLGSGAALIALGEKLRRQPEFEMFSAPVIGGGWILVYFAAFASHWLPAARLIENPTLGLLFLCAAAWGMIAHSLAVRSRLLTDFAFGAAFFALAVTNLGVQSLTVCTVLALAGALLVRKLRYPELAAVCLAGFYANYLPFFREVLATAGAHRLPAPDFWYGLFVATAVHVVYALVSPAKRDDGEPEPATDAVLSVGSVLYAVLIYSQVTAYDPSRPAAALLGLSGVLLGLSAARGRRSSESALEAVQAMLAFLVAAIAAFKLPDPASQLWGLGAAASVFGTTGLWLGRDRFEGYGMALVGLAAATVLGNWGEFASLRWNAGPALVYLGLAGYALAGLRHAKGRADDFLTGAWIHTGLASVVLAAFLCLEPAGFALTAMALALALEQASLVFGVRTLRSQALIVETKVALYSFLIDYGANLPVLGFVTPRLLVSAGLAAGLGSLSLAERTGRGSCLGISYSSWRRAQSWLMTAIACFAVYGEFGPRLRLPLWALGSLVLLWQGRKRGVSGGQLRLQSSLLAIGTAAEGILSYLYYPSALMPAVGWRETAVYAASSALLLWPLAWPAWAQNDLERSEELGGCYLLSILSLALAALFVAKEADGAYITLGWTLIGVPYMLGGLLSRRKALRLPGLALVGLCVGKALLMDLTGLALPYRVLSYTILGGLLLLSSFVYVQHTKEEDADAA